MKHRENGFVPNPKSPTFENSSFRTVILTMITVDFSFFNVFFKRFFQEKGKLSRRHRDISPTENHYRDILPNYQRGQIQVRVNFMSMIRNSNFHYSIYLAKSDKS